MASEIGTGKISRKGFTGAKKISARQANLERLPK
jgi:hypothetical protein